jgi:hypothetical protein
MSPLIQTIVMAIVGMGSLMSMRVSLAISARASESAPRVQGTRR